MIPYHPTSHRQVLKCCYLSSLALQDGVNKKDSQLIHFPSEDVYKRASQYVQYDCPAVSSSLRLCFQPTERFRAERGCSKTPACPDHCSTVSHTTQARASRRYCWITEPTARSPVQAEHTVSYRNAFPFFF